MEPITLCVQDVMDIMNFSEKTAREFMKDCKAFAGKEQSVPMTLFDFCYYLKIRVEDYREWVERK